MLGCNSTLSTRFSYVRLQNCEGAVVRVGFCGNPHLRSEMWGTRQLPGRWEGCPWWEALAFAPA